MKKLIPAIAIAAVGIVSLAASPARADEHGWRGESRERAPYSEPVRAMPQRRLAPVRYYRHERWEAETGYQALKTHQRGPRRVLRSEHPDGIDQEIYAYLVTHQAVRQLMTDAAARAGVDPDRLSFTTALRLACRTVAHQLNATARTLAAAVRECLQDRNTRRDRVSPRAVKRPVSPYKSKANTTPRTSTKVTYALNIIDAGGP